jgi:hypothetical protein
MMVVAALVGSTMGEMVALLQVAMVYMSTYLTCSSVEAP